MTTETQTETETSPSEAPAAAPVSASDAARLELAELIEKHCKPKPPEFDWQTDDSIVIERQPAIAVYRNRRQHVVIRSEGYDDDDDPFITVAGPEDLQRLISALQRELRTMREERR